MRFVIVHPEFGRGVVICLHLEYLLVKFYDSPELRLIHKEFLNER